MAAKTTFAETLPFNKENAADIHTVFYCASGSGYEAAKAADRFGPGVVGLAAATVGVRCRVVLISSQLVDKEANKYSLVRGLLNTIATGVFHRQGLMDFKWQGERLLRESGVASWTILRPGRLGDGAAGSSGALRVGQNNGSFCPGSIVGRIDLAALAVACAFSDDAANTTLEVGAEPSAPALDADTAAGLFQGLTPDPLPHAKSSPYWQRVQVRSP